MLFTKDFNFTKKLGKYTLKIHRTNWYLAYMIPTGISPTSSQSLIKGNNKFKWQSS